MKPGNAAAVRVLVVEDSPTYRQLLVGIVDADPRLHVVGVAHDGQGAVAMAAQLRPDVILMDIHLPVIDGFTATRRIMESCPTRIVMVTATSIPDEVSQSFEALESGALAVLAKPPGPGHPQFDALRQELLRTLKLMSEVHVVRRWPGVALRSGVAEARKVLPVHAGGIGLVVVGASTGGPVALQALLGRLDAHFEVPIVVVQHISLGFADGLAQWLERGTSRKVRVASDGDRLEPGGVLVAPDGAHTLVRARRAGESMGRIELSMSEPENGFRPSVAPLFRSAAEEFGPRAAGVLLTGMGRDGAKELKLMRQAGALTMVQDGESAVVNGMPGEAARIGAAMHVMPPETMAVALNGLAR